MSAPSVPPRGLRVLVVDDNTDAAATLALLLELSGHETRVARDGFEALALAAAFRPQVGLLDIGLPDMDGHELARRLREAPGGQQLVLVALSGWSPAPAPDASAAAGFDAHLVKPVGPDALLKQLQALVARRGIASP